MKVIKYTDSNLRDFEFSIYNTIVRFYYIVPAPKIKSFKGWKNASPGGIDLRVEDIENNIFPKSLYDFQEAKDYIRRYITNIAFL